MLLNEVIDRWEKADGLDWRSNADLEFDRPSPGWEPSYSIEPKLGLNVFVVGGFPPTGIVPLNAAADDNLAPRELCVDWPLITPEMELVFSLSCLLRY